MYIHKMRIALLLLMLFSLMLSPASTSGDDVKIERYGTKLEGTRVSKPVGGEIITWAILDSGGGLRHSASHAFLGSFGEIATGVSSSATQTLLAGYVAGISVLPYPGCSFEGDPAFYVDFGEDSHEVIAGATVCWTVGPTNFGFVSGSCPDTDTFCVWAYDSQGWVITGDPTLEGCYILDPGYLWWQDICVTVPCDVSACDYDTLIIIMSYCDGTIACRHDCTDLPACEDPNWYGGNPYYSADTVVLHVAESPPALYILQDSLYYIEQGQTAGYIPFSICNGDPCAPPTSYDYTITSLGHVGPPINQSGSGIWVEGGECDDVYGVLDAGFADVCDMDTLTIIAWDTETGTVYDTCIQLVHVVEPMPVPLFTVPVVTILVLAIILVSAVIMKKRIEKGDKEMKATRILIIALAVVVAFPSLGMSDVPEMINYQGKLTTSGGDPVNGTYSIVFSIYDTSTGGSPLWTETQPSVDVSEGLFSVLLGSVTPIPGSVFDGSVLYLGVKVGADPELLPRREIVSVGYAYKAGAADSDGDWTVSGSDMYSAVSGNVGIGTASPSSMLHVRSGVGTGSIAVESNVGVKAGFNSYNTYSRIGTDTNHRFLIMSNGTGRIWVEADGKISVGKPNPTKEFDVEGTVKMTGFEMPTGANDGYVLTSNALGVGTWQAATGGIGGSGAANYIPKFTGPTTLGNSLIYESGSEIGIGTTSPEATLHVRRSDWTASIMVESLTGVKAGFNSYNTYSRIGTDTNHRFLIMSNGTGRIWVETDGKIGIGTSSAAYELDVAGQAHASSFPTSSDRRLKKDVKQLTDVLEKVGKIRGVSFDWNELYESLGRSTGHREIGLIAQEVEAVFPELITSWGEEGYMAVDYGRLTGVLVEAVKELKAENEALRQRIEVLENNLLNE